jgi:hypothetical protein
MMIAPEFAEVRFGIGSQIMDCPTIAIYICRDENFDPQSEIDPEKSSCEGVITRYR